MDFKVRLLATSILALPLTIHAASAQDAAQPATTTAQSDTGQIEEVVVTAERHAQSILSVPASIQAETFTQLDNEGIHNLTDLQDITPGYSVTDSSGYTMIFIRGLGNNNFVGPESNVATYIDDVPRLWGQFANTFVDVQRVEVLKGAQGGLYGRNATGGVVNVITEQPSTDEFYGTGRFSYGELGTIDAAAFLNVPISDTLAFTIAAEHDSHDAYVRNISIHNPYNSSLPSPLGPFFGALNTAVDPHGLDTQNTYGLDSKILWQPSSHFKVTLAGDYYYKGDSNGNQNFTATPYIPQAYLEASNGLGLLYGIPQFLLPTEQSVTGKFQTATGDNLEQNLHDWGSSMTMVYNAPFADFTSITAYRANHSVLDADLCACSVPAGTAIVDIARQYYYEELRAVSTTDGPIHWLGGATFLADHQAYNTDFVIAPIVNVNTAHAYDLIKNWTVYGQLGYDITTELNLTASLRWEHETNSAVFPALPAQPPGAAQEGLDKLIPSATLNYALDNGTAYIRWARGIQSGGVNPVASVGLFNLVGAPLSDGSTFGPEEVDTYEAGYKQALMNHTLQLTGDIFYNKINGLQESAHAEPAYQSAVILAIVGAGSARTYGAEGSVDWQALDALKLGANVGYLDAAYSNSSYGDNLVLVHTVLSHTVLPNSPKWQVSLTADVDKPLDDRFDFIFHAVETHLSSQLYDQSTGTIVYNLAPGGACPGTGATTNAPCQYNIPNAIAPGYWLTNLRIGVKTNDDAYQLSVFANNLFDQKYLSYGSVSAESGDLFGWGNPRIVGAEFDVNY